MDDIAQAPFCAASATTRAQVSGLFRCRFRTYLITPTPSISLHISMIPTASTGQFTVVEYHAEDIATLATATSLSAPGLAKMPCYFIFTCHAYLFL